MTVEEFFYDHPVFRQEEFVALKAEHGIDNRSTVHQALHYYLESKQIVSIRRGLYAVVPPTFTPENLPIDSYLIAGKATSDSILAYHTALELYGIAYSVFFQFTFVTAQKVKPFTYSDMRFKPVAVPKVLVKNKEVNFGVEITERNGVEVKITSPARTYVDVIDRVELSGGWEEVSRAITQMTSLDVEQVVDYCCKLESPVIAAKVGFFLQQRQGGFAVADKFLQRLLQMKPKSPYYLVKSRRQPCEFIKQWNLMVPKNILYQTWEEPNYDV